jgi:hypothetical protein
MEFWQVFATGSVVAATGLSFLLFAVAPIGKAQEVVRLRLQCAIRRDLLNHQLGRGRRWFSGGHQYGLLRISHSN